MQHVAYVAVIIDLFVRTAGGVDEEQDYLGPSHRLEQVGAGAKGGAGRQVIVHQRLGGVVGLRVERVHMVAGYVHPHHFPPCLSVHKSST